MIPCPCCGTKLTCGCPACKERYPSENLFILAGENEYCSACGFTAHVDFWLELEYQLYSEGGLTYEGVL